MPITSPIHLTDDQLNAVLAVVFLCYPIAAAPSWRRARASWRTWPRDRRRRRASRRVGGAAPVFRSADIRLRRQRRRANTIGWRAAALAPAEFAEAALGEVIRHRLDFSPMGEKFKNRPQQPRFQIYYRGSKIQKAPEKKTLPPKTRFTGESMLKGQWFGPYAGTHSGNIVAEFDEIGGNLVGTVLLTRETRYLRHSPR